jgi:type IV secretion system protein TrbF
MRPFRRATIRYGRTEAAETPYQRAAQVWDERIGSARVQAANWRFAFLGMLLLAFLLAGGLLHQAARSSITPYVVEVDRLGEARAVAPAEANYQPTDPQIAWHLARFIEAVRSVSIDPIVLRQNWLRAYDWTTDRGAIALNEHARANDPFARIGQVSVAVEMVSVVRASDSSFRLAWIERRYDNGSLAATERWTAILTTIVQVPREREKLRKNPLGIYITAINWSKELG